MGLKKPKRDWIIMPRKDRDRYMRGPYKTALKHLIQQTAKQHSLTPDDILGPRRYRRFVDARSDVAVQLSSWGWSLPEIGDALGGRHHTSVLNLLRRAERKPTHKEG